MSLPEFFSAALGTRIEPDGPILTWASGNGLAESPWLLLANDVVPNPAVWARSDAGAELKVMAVVGNAHGDLHLQNILLPVLSRRGRAGNAFHGLARETEAITEARGILREIGLLEVENTPESGVEGKDLQLDKAIEWSLEQLKKSPVNRPARPAYKKQAASTAGTPTDSGR